jgi:hypothetical protein
MADTRAPYKTNTAFGGTYVHQVSVHLITSIVEFYVLLTVHVGINFANNQLDAQFFFIYVYFYSLHVSGSHVPIIRKINFINTISGIFYSVFKTV